MNQEHFLAGALFCIGLGIMAGALAYWWAHRDNVKQMQDWEDELTDRELAVQGELIQAQLTRSETQMLHDETTRMHIEAEKRYRDAAELVKETRRQLYGMAADSVQLDDEMADTQLIDPITDSTLIQGPVR